MRSSQPPRKWSPKNMKIKTEIRGDSSKLNEFKRAGFNPTDTSELNITPQQNLPTPESSLCEEKVSVVNITQPEPKQVFDPAPIEMDIK